jgi:hypothetical protein
VRWFWAGDRDGRGEHELNFSATDEHGSAQMKTNSNVLFDAAFMLALLLVAAQGSPDLFLARAMEGAKG